MTRRSKVISIVNQVPEITGLETKNEGSEHEDKWSYKKNFIY